MQEFCSTYIFLEGFLSSARYDFIKKNIPIYISNFSIFRHVWFWAKDISISHDSYTCRSYPYTKSFPTRRKNEINNFVGAVVGKVIIEKSRGGRFLWNSNWDLGSIWAGWHYWKKNIWANYEQLLRPVFSCFHEQKNFLKNILDGENIFGIEWN